MALGSKRANRTAGRTSGRKALLALSLALSATGAVALANTDALVERGFAIALQTPSATAAHSRPASVTAPVAGSEEFWLSAVNAANSGTPGAVSLAAWTAPVKLGASLTLTIAGQEHALEVIAIAELPASVTHVDTSAPAGGLVMVSCREPGKPDGAVLRFLVEPGAQTSPQVAVATPRAL